MRRLCAEVGLVAVATLLVAACSWDAADAAAPTTPPPCGLWEGDEFNASNEGPCVLPDGEVMGSAIWIRRNPGTNVNYNVNWTYGGDGSHPGPGYAALHGCMGDTVTFNFFGGPHNVVLVDTEGTAFCNFTNAVVAQPTVDSPFTFVLTTEGRANYWVYSDTVGDNCVNGAMHIQIIFHKPPTPKYGCFYPDKVPPGLPIYPPAPTDSVTIAGPVPKSPPPPKAKSPPPPKRKPPPPKPHVKPHTPPHHAPHPRPHTKPHPKPHPRPHHAPHPKPHPKPHHAPHPAG